MSKCFWVTVSANGVIVESLRWGEALRVIELTVGKVVRAHVCDVSRRFSNIFQMRKHSVRSSNKQEADRAQTRPCERF